MQLDSARMQFEFVPMQLASVRVQFDNMRVQFGCVRVQLGQRADAGGQRVGAVGRHADAVGRRAGAVGRRTNVVWRRACAASVGINCGRDSQGVALRPPHAGGPHGDPGSRLALGYFISRLQREELSPPSRSGYRLSQLRHVPASRFD